MKGVNDMSRLKCGREPVKLSLSSSNRIFIGCICHKRARPRAATVKQTKMERHENVLQM